MFSWLKIGINFIKTLGGQGDDKSDLDTPGTAENESVAAPSPCKADIDVQSESPCIATEDSSENQQKPPHCDLANSIAVRPESQIVTKVEDPPNGQELARRRKIMRQFFNDFWSSRDEKPGTFAERLNQAEDYINERLTACGEAWLLDSATRNQLGLPPQLHPR
jgi:hypothetical protein